MITLRKYQGNFVPWESLIGKYDSTNQVYTTINRYKPGSVIVYYNGQALFSDNDFSESGPKEIVLTYIKPSNNLSLKASYIRG